MRRPFILFLFASLLLATLAPAQQENLNLELIYSGRLTPQKPSSMAWSPDGSRLTYVFEQNDHRQLWSVEASGGEPQGLVSAAKFESMVPPLSALANEREREWRLRYDVPDYHWSPDGKNLLFDGVKQLWLYDLENGAALQFTSGGDPLRDPKFSPDGSRVSFVRNGDLWVQELDDRRPKRITRAESEEVLNGDLDWVYAEELDARSNYFWSPDSRHIAFLQMDERLVHEHPITDLAPVNARWALQKYPQPGTPNPAVRVGVIGSGGGRPRWIELPDGSPGDHGRDDIYIPRFGWVNSAVLYLLVLNRDQDQLDLYFVDRDKRKPVRMLRETSDAWVEAHDFHLLPSGGGFLWLSRRDGFRHIYLYRFNRLQPLAGPAELARQLTRGDWEVTAIEGIDAKAGVVYFLAAYPDARERQLMRVSLEGGEPQRVSRETGWHETLFSPDATHFALTHSDVASTTRMSLCDAGAACREFWSAPRLTEYGLRPPEFVEFQAEDGSLLYGSLLLPPGVQPGDTSARIPVIVRPYGGPTGQVVKRQWSGKDFLLDQVLAREGFAVLRVDNRGTPQRGEQFNAALLRNFGEVELKDQLASLRQAGERYPALDTSRAGIIGASYGGYMVLYAMTHSGAFAAGVSIAPVTDWLDYDTIYTERYMKLPQDNQKGYKDSSPVNNAATLHGALFLAHGTSDDNVHLQNSIQMIQALITAGKQFDLMLYPGKTHGIRGQAALTHLYTRVLEHFREHLMGGTRQ